MKPSEEYTIHIMPDEEFDLLPVGKPKEAQGMTDAKRKIAWVRHSGVKELDRNTINHEFDELMQGTSLHEVDGIRYKPALIPFIAKAIASAFIGKGVSNTISTGNPFKGPSAPKQQQASFTSPFAPQSARQGPGPLSELDFKTGLGNIDKNLQARETDIFRQSGFRGQKESENTALASALGNARTSGTAERDLFIKQQEDAKRQFGTV